MRWLIRLEPLGSTVRQVCNLPPTGKLQTCPTVLAGVLRGRTARRGRAGGNPGGSAAAMFLAKKGIRTAIVEKMTFPRYHIGESMSGECGAMLRELGLESKMIDRRDPIKHGVSVYGPRGKDSFYVPVMAR